MKTEKTVVEIENYTPPQMTVVPVRVSGTMLVGSMRVYNEMESFRDEFQQSSDVEDGINYETMVSASGWDGSFFD